MPENKSPVQYVDISKYDQWLGRYARELAMATEAVSTLESENRVLREEIKKLQKALSEK